MRDHVVAVDIGTGSARAGVFDARGRLLAKSEHPIVMNRPRENHAEHDSEESHGRAQLVRADLFETGADCFAQNHVTSPFSLWGAGALARLRGYALLLR